MHEVNFSQCLFLAAVVLTALCGAVLVSLKPMYAITLKY